MRFFLGQFFLFFKVTAANHVCDLQLFESEACMHASLSSYLQLHPLKQQRGKKEKEAH